MALLGTDMNPRFSNRLKEALTCTPALLYGCKSVPSAGPAAIWLESMDEQWMTGPACIFHLAMHAYMRACTQRPWFAVGRVLLFPQALHLYIISMSERAGFAKCSARTNPALSHDPNFILIWALTSAPLRNTLFLQDGITLLHDFYLSVTYNIVSHRQGIWCNHGPALHNTLLPYFL
eukprot:1156918-Pelagomonas_calceolata.AAC.2